MFRRNSLIKLSVVIDMFTPANIIAAVASCFAPAVLLFYAVIYLFNLFIIIVFDADIMNFMEMYREKVVPIVKWTVPIGAVISFFAIDHGAYVRFFGISLISLYFYFSHLGDEYLDGVLRAAREHRPYEGY